MDLGHYYSLLNHTVYVSPDGHSPYPSTVGFYNGLHTFEHTAPAEPTATPLLAQHTAVHDTGDKGPNTHWVHGENIESIVNM